MAEVSETDPVVLYWISGSPPAWRVMLALTLKGIAFEGKRLDVGAGDNRTSQYLALNPLGQVPTLQHGRLVIRESLAILAYLDRAFPERMLFGDTPAQAAAIWQQVMLFETQLAGPAGIVARGLMRGVFSTQTPEHEAALEALATQLSGLDEALGAVGFLNSDSVSAADVWLYPLLGWLERAVAITPCPPIALLEDWRLAWPRLARWQDRMAQLDGVAGTYPPHWAADEAAHT